MSITLPRTRAWIAIVGLFGFSSYVDASSGGVAPQTASSEVVWNTRTAEHLWNRAGFGARPGEIARAVEIGQEAFVAELLAGEPILDVPFYARVRRRSALMDPMTGMEMTGADRKQMVRDLRRDDLDQMRDFLSWWVERMVAGRDPLRERMTLFWHGYFTSSFDDVKNSHEMIVQNQLLRSEGMGSFRILLRNIARDPAMLEYLDSDSNRKGSPNENFARELMELFTLGEGNYSEHDVKEAARAFTGWADQDGEFRFNRRRHDKGEKTVFGRTGRFDGNDVIDLILARKACPRHVAAKMLTYFEGAEPSETRLADYAGFLRSSDFDLHGLLEKLFLDPEFYRDEVIGARIASPIDFLVGSVRRLGADPPARLLLLGASLLGERLFFPPNVKGWEGGGAWITTASLMQRGNFAGVLLGEVTLDDFLDYDPLDDEALDPFGAPGADMGSASMEGAADDEVGRRARDRRALGDLRKLNEIRRSGWRPRLNLSASLRRANAVDDQEIIAALAELLLGVPIAPSTQVALIEMFRAAREELEIDERRLEEHPWEAEELFRRTAHIVLSLPEAQLN